MNKLQNNYIGSKVRSGVQFIQLHVCYKSLQNLSGFRKLHTYQAEVSKELPSSGTSIFRLSST